MAIIKGITIKSLKTFMGQEGQGFSGNIYLDGKKIGTVTDAAYGGCYDYYFDKGKEKEVEEFKKRIRKYFEENPRVDYLKTYYMSLEDFKKNKDNLPKQKVEDMIEVEDSFICNLVDLSQLEKSYKKYAKLGYPIMIALDAHAVAKIPMPQPQEIACKEGYDYQKYVIDDYIEKHPTGYATIYKSLDDFIIN